MTTRGWIMMVAVVTGAVALVMTSVDVSVHRAPHETATSWAIELRNPLAWTVVLVAMILFLRFRKFPEEYHKA
jgi:hypothetical protein